MKTDWRGERGERWVADLAGFEAMLRPVDAPILHALSLGGARRIADIGCGSGATTLALRRATPPETIVHGFDLSPALVDLARSLARGVRVGFEQVDVERSPAPEEPYDRLTSRFGIMFFDQPREAFQRLRDWLVPGGRFAFAVWGPAKENAWARTVRDVVASVAEVPRPDPDAPGPFRYGEVSSLVALLRSAGFEGVEALGWRGPLPVGADPGAEAAARFALRAFSTFAGLLSAAGPEASQNAHQALTSRFAAKVGPDGFVRMDASVHLVVGLRGASSSTRR